MNKSMDFAHSKATDVWGKKQAFITVLLGYIRITAHHLCSDSKRNFQKYF